MIKPNVTSWRSIIISNIYAVSQKMNDEDNRYGFTSNVDTHMMKNSEWAIVAYLSQSRYGKLGNTNFTGANKEIYQNKSDQFITGCSYGSPSNGNTDYGCQYQYNTDINGTGASATGNIYGIYDMSGGAWEYVMADYNDTIVNSECLGHSLSETNGWYNDAQTFVNTGLPWLLRGGYYSVDSNAGVFLFQSGDATNMNGSFRLVISSNT